MHFEPLLIFDTIYRIRQNLTDDLLKPKYRKMKRSVQSEGHCYVATEALYYLADGKKNDLMPCVLRVDGDTHWFLMQNNGSSTTIYDPTYDQFGDNPPNYLGAKRCHFLTKKPSKRASILINKVKKSWL